MMKVNTGVIVYIVGGEDTYDDFDMKEAVRRLNINAERVEVVSSMEDNFDVMHAWWLLTVKGMKLIVCSFTTQTYWPRA
jgi:hypothetical protein